MKWYHHFGKQLLLVKLNMNLPHDPAILFLGICLREMKTCPHEDLYMNIHRSIIIIGINWKKSKCLSADQHISKMWCIWYENRIDYK